MAKKGSGFTTIAGAEIPDLKIPDAITSAEEAAELLEAMELLDELMRPYMQAAVQIKKLATEFAVKKKLDVIQLDGRYYRQIVRHQKRWVGTPDEMPTPKPKGAKSIKEICKGKSVKIKGVKKPLWNFLTKRVPDTEKIDIAIKRGYITEDEIEKAYLEKPGEPFLQRFNGEAD